MRSSTTTKDSERPKQPESVGGKRDDLLEQVTAQIVAAIINTKGMQYFYMKPPDMDTLNEQRVQFAVHLAQAILTETAKVKKS